MAGASARASPLPSAALATGLSVSTQSGPCGLPGAKEAVRGPDAVLMASASPFPHSLELEISLLGFGFDFWATLGIRHTFSGFGHPGEVVGVISQAPDRE